MTDLLNVYIPIYADHWKAADRATFQQDWLDPLLNHPNVNKIILGWQPEHFGEFASDRVIVEPAVGDQRIPLDHYGVDPDVVGIIRLVHLADLRFPLTEQLVHETIKGYFKECRGGYYKVDLLDLPYNYLYFEIMGRDALTAMMHHVDLPLDWNHYKFRSFSFPIRKRHLTLAERLSYLDNDKVEFFSFPRFIALEASRMCNLRCTMCVTHSDFIDTSYLKKFPKHFSFDKFKSIVDQMEPYKKYVSIAPQFQGEPFLAPQLDEMIRYAKDKNMLVGFTSNATLWSDDRIKFMIEQGVNSLVVSIDGASKQTYDAIRVGADYDEVVGNIDRLIELRKELSSDPQYVPYISLNMTLLPENRHEKQIFLDRWLAKLPTVSINNTCINDVVPEKNFEPERFPCPFPWEGMHILTNGDVVTCCRDNKYEVVLGNAYETPILEIWNNAKYREMRRLHMEERWDEIEICKRCDTWMVKTERVVREAPYMVIETPVNRRYSLVESK